MKPRDLVLAQLRHEETDPIPYVLDWREDVWDRLDAHYGGTAWREGLNPYIANCGAVAHLPRVPLDEHRYRDAFGTIWDSSRGRGVVVEPGLRSRSFDGYQFPAIEDARSLPMWTSAASRVAETTEAFTLVAPGLSLFDAYYIRGFEQSLEDIAADEGWYAELLDRTTDLVLAMIAEGADIPADAAMMGDDWGDQRGVLVGPERWRRLFKPRYAHIFDAIHAQGKLAIMHCCGSVADIMGDIVEIGLDCLESCQPEAAGMDPYRLKELWGDRITFWGCLGSQSLIPFGTPGAIRAEVAKLRRCMGKGGGYILACAKPLDTDTPTANAVAVVEAFTESGTQ